MVCVSPGVVECRSAELQPKGLGRQTRSDDSGARNWGLLREWNLCDAIKQEQLEVACYYLPAQVCIDCPCSLPCQTCARHMQIRICL